MPLWHHHPTEPVGPAGDPNSIPCWSPSFKKEQFFSLPTRASSSRYYWDACRPSDTFLPAWAMDVACASVLGQTVPPLKDWILNIHGPNWCKPSKYIEVPWSRKTTVNPATFLFFSGNKESWGNLWTKWYLYWQKFTMGELTQRLES